MRAATLMTCACLAACASAGHSNPRFDAAITRDAALAPMDTRGPLDATPTTSDAFVEIDDASVEQPDVFVATSDAFASAPDSFVAAHDAFVPPIDAYVGRDAFVARDAYVGHDAASSGVVACSSAAACTGRLVISEVAPHGPSSATDEFVEVENTSTAMLDISGVELVYYSASGASSHRATAQAGVVIPPGGFALFASTTFSDLTADVTEHWSQGLADAGGTVELRVGTAAIDRFGWGTATVFEGAAYTPASTTGASSYERKASASSTAVSMSSGGTDEHAGNRYDTDRNASDFVTRSSRDPANLASGPE